MGNGGGRAGVPDEWRLPEADGDRIGWDDDWPAGTRNVYGPIPGLRGRGVSLTIGALATNQGGVPPPARKHHGVAVPRCGGASTPARPAGAGNIRGRRAAAQV